MKGILFDYSLHSRQVDPQVVSVEDPGRNKDKIMRWCILNTLRPRQDGHHFPDDIFKCIFLNANVYISIKISLKFVPKGPINNIPALVQIMAWRLLCDKSLSEPLMASLLTQICITLPQWVNDENLWMRTYWGVCAKDSWDPFSDID